MVLPDFLTEVAYGEIVLTGHRIGLYTVVRLYKEGWSAEQIAEEFPSLPLDLVRRVLAYYHQNQAGVDAYVEDYRQELDRQAAAPPKGPDLAELQRRWRAMGLGELP